MNPRWLLIRRLRGPAFLLTFALTALLNQWDVLSFGQSWPLYLIVAGSLTLAERAALAGTPAPAPYGVPYSGQQTYQGQYSHTGTSVVPVAPEGFRDIQHNDSDPSKSGRS